MRNLALEYVITTHSFITDGDHIPSPNMEDNIIKHANDGYLKGATVSSLIPYKSQILIMSLNDWLSNICPGDDHSCFRIWEAARWIHNGSR